ncbi:hypothetical protein TRFO_36023 [Tritrichomonas foetus]|uniref:Uncharacterized protein n=1 Tax=Tritrichomonas foetus TaxID=1144522 RepID=A0A1J4JET6_9EUKA|nr:hypothetical protein TRFO_36023 [Tritrichomonas foetus]|eukprot:OHS97702.1 hypothetical protein TRFO_36023 [Tritrichomonas foetus]
MNNPKLQGHFTPPELPCKEWLKQFAESLGIKVVGPQSLELSRRIYCSYDKTAEFFVKSKTLIHRDPSLILNFDETMLQTKKRFKVLCSQQAVPLIVDALINCLTLQEVSQSLLFHVCWRNIKPQRMPPG